MKILIVERDISLLETIRDICHEEGHETVTSTSCDHARLRLQSEKAPDIIFCDQFLPGNHGIAFRKELLHRREIRFVLMRALMGSHEELNSNELAKPFSIDDLLRFLRVRPS